MPQEKQYIILFSNIKSCHFLQQPGATEKHIPINN